MRIKIIQARIPIVVSPRVVIAVVLSGVAFALAAFGMLGANLIAGMSGHGSLAAGHFGGLSSSHVPGLIALASSIGAVIVSWRHRSFLVAGLLIGAGILYSLHLGSFLGNHSPIGLYGPIIGVLSGHVMLALGIAQALRLIRTTVAKAVT